MVFCLHIRPVRFVTCNRNPKIGFAAFRSMWSSNILPTPVSHVVIFWSISLNSSKQLTPLGHRPLMHLTILIDFTARKEKNTLLLSHQISPFTHPLILINISHTQINHSCILRR
ncbi:hypothetical protein BKKJ1_1763 [Bifidobacterium catenulatum subsp. kashiwanohense]|nr:hypothetical protein BKKJ1_1763 [Bifidobacterium catenulatum subsp. kashiwanohense]